jgi:hypothetical protein
MTKINILFYILFIFVIGVVLVTPHIIHNFGYINENYAQSMVILLDIIGGHILFLIYRKKVRELSEEKDRHERRLQASYKYIGKINGEKEVSDDLMNYLKKYRNGLTSRKAVFATFLSTMIISAAKADQGILRFISLPGKKTVKNYFYSVDGKPANVNLSNDQALAGRMERSPRQNYKIMESDYDFGGLKCILAFPAGGAKPDQDLLKMLINQAHLFFVASAAASAGTGE